MAASSCKLRYTEENVDAAITYAMGVVGVEERRNKAKR